MLTTLPLRAPRRRIASLLVTTSLLFGLLLVSAPGVDAGRGGCKVTNETTGKTYAGLTRAVSTAEAGHTLSIIETCWGSFTIDKDLTLQGDPSATLQGTGRARVLTIELGATVTLTDLTITGGAESGDAGIGGGIYNGGTLTLTDTTVSGNTTGGDGGGIWNSGALTLNTSTVSGNAAASDFGGNGGGIYNDNGTVTLTGSTVFGNTAAFLGGGIYNNNGSVTLNNSTVGANNTAVFGGGIVNDAGGIFLLGTSSVTGNTALVFEDSGGGIFNVLGTISPNCNAVFGNTPDDCYDSVPEV